MHTGQSDAIAREHLFVGLSAQTAWCHIWCTPDRYYSLSSAPPECWLTAQFVDFFHCFFWAYFVLESWTSTHLLGLFLRCCILGSLVQPSSHHVNYRYKH
jgi:hypothetical protein